MILAVIVGGSNLYLYCYFGQSAHDHYIDLSDVYFEANWRKLPDELQKYFTLMCANAQLPLYYHGFGVAYINLNTFLRVSVP